MIKSFNSIFIQVQQFLKGLRLKGNKMKILVLYKPSSNPFINGILFTETKTIIISEKELDRVGTLGTIIAAYEIVRELDIEQKTKDVETIFRQTHYQEIKI